MVVERVKKLEGGTWDTYRETREQIRKKWFGNFEGPPTTLVYEDWMENKMFTMPLLENGVFGIGDLFDIKAMSPVGACLIHYNRLTENHLIAHPRKHMEYKFDLISDTMDLLDSLKVEASLSISMALSDSINLNISGTAMYDSLKHRNFYDQEIKCTYRNELFTVQLQPSAIEGDDHIVNENVRAQLNTGKLNATHICTEVVMGGEAIANIYDKKDDEDDNLTINGSLQFYMGITSPEITIDAQAAVEFNKKSLAHHQDTRITVYSKPPFKMQPNTVADMIECIKGLPAAIEEEAHYPMLPIVKGVPLRYKLVPIDQVIELATKIRKTFRSVETSLLNSFIVVLASLKDYQSKEFIKRKIYEREPRTLTMLKDLDNPVTMEISAWEAELATASKTIQIAADFAWEAYKKNGKEEDFDDTILRDVLVTFDERIGVLNVFQKIEEFRRACKKETVGVHMTDVDEQVQVTFLSNDIDMEDWYGSERRMKILLQTNTEGSHAPTGTFLRLYNLSKHLKTLGADIGIAYPSISSGFQLNIKTNAVESVYIGDDIVFALNILGLAVGKADIVPRLFWTVNGALTGIQLPLTENISDIPSLVAISRELQDVKICPTYLALREELAKEDGRVKIVLDVKALESIADSVVFMRRLRSELEKEPALVPVDWVVGSFDLIKFHDAPISFSFLNNQLFAVCLDNLDMLLLLEQLRSETPDFELLRAENLKSKCFYPTRGNFGMHVAELLGQYHGSMTDSIEELGSFARPMQRMGIKEYLKEYNGLLDALFVNRELISGEEMRVVSAIGTICIRIFPQMLTNLKTMGWNEAANLFHTNLKAAVWMDITGYLQEFLENENPLLAKADYLRKKIAEVLKSYADGDESVNLDDVIEAINVIINHTDPSCPIDLRDELLSYKDAKPEMKLKGYMQALTTYVEKEYTLEKYFSLRNLMTFSDKIAKRSPTEENIGNLIPDTVALYIERVLTDPVLEKFPGADKKLREYLEKKNFYQTVSLMAKLQYDHKLFMLHQKFYQLLDVEDADYIKRTINKMGKLEFDPENYEDLWGNRKFTYYMLKGLDSQGVLEAIAAHQCPENIIPLFMPVEFEEKLIPMLVSDEDLAFEWKQNWETLEDALKVFQTITVRKAIPKTFAEILRDNMENNSELKTTLSEIGALSYWDDERRIFTQPWALPTIANAVDLIMEFLENQRETRTITTLEEMVLEEMDLDRTLNVADKWKTIAKELVSRMGLEDYNLIKDILKSPIIDYRELETAMTKIIPYVIQQVKFLSPDPISPKQVYNYIKYPKVSDTNRPGVIEFGKAKEKQRVARISRGDILTYLANSSDAVVFQHVLSLMGQFSKTALPLAVSDFDSSINDSGIHHKLLYPQLKNLFVHTEDRNKKIIENQLFSNPFKLTVVVRLGDRKKGIGKSPILNSVMASPNNLFSSINDAQSADLDKPISNNGYLEFATLTKSNCKNTLWKKVEDSYYSRVDHSNQVLLLANLHGDASEHYKLLSALKEIGSQFLVLLMSDTWDRISEKAQEFTNTLDSEDCTLFALVDPIEDLDSEGYTNASVITTEEIKSGNTTRLENLLMATYDNSQPIPSLDTMNHNFVGVQTMETPQSKQLVQLIKKHSCRSVRQMLQYNNTQFVDMWSENEDYKELIEAFLTVLRLPTVEREGSLSHVKIELSILSKESSLKSRSEFLQLIEELHTSVNAEIPIPDEIRNLQNQVKGVKNWIDDRTLGLEHFFREVGRYHCSQVSPTMVFTGRYADHILKGNEIEIFNRDGDGNIFWGEWMKDTFLNGMAGDFRTKKIFVVSIVGLISSGKSTLLNALFGCKFSVSIAGGTQGIFMKLLFLEEELRQQLKVDIIVLLDTQGISTIGGGADETTLRNEQQLIALTVGLSNLTLLNTRGRNLGNMANVLETVFTKLTTIPELKLIPDFFLVHHQQKNRSLQTEFPIVELTNSLRAVSDLTDKNEMDIGVSESIGRRMNKIMRRVKHNDIVSIIGPYQTVNRQPSKIYNQTVVELYEKILTAVKESDKILTFEEWYGYSQSFWGQLTCGDNTSILRFKNSAEAQEYLDLQNKISAIKDLIDWAFLNHEEGLKKEIKQIEDDAADVLRRKAMNEPGIELLDVHRDGFRRVHLDKVWKALRKMAGTCECVLKGESGLACVPCLDALQQKEALFATLSGSNYKFETQEKLNDYIVAVRTSIWNRLLQSLISYEMKTKDEDEELLSTQYNEALEKLQSVESSERWRVIQQWVSPWTTVVSADVHIQQEVAEHYSNLPSLVSRVKNEQEPLPNLGEIKALDLDYYNAIKVFYLELPEEEESAGEEGEPNEESEDVDEPDCGCKGNADKSPYLDWTQKDWLEAQLKDVSELMWQSRSLFDQEIKTSRWVYQVGMIRELQKRVNKILVEFEQRLREKLLPNFKWEAHIFTILYFLSYFRRRQEEWDAVHQPLLQIDKNLVARPGMADMS